MVMQEEPLHLPTLDRLHVIPGLCDGVFLGTEALASLKTPPHRAALGYHDVNIPGSKKDPRFLERDAPP